MLEQIAEFNFPSLIPCLRRDRLNNTVNPVDGAQITVRACRSLTFVWNGAERRPHFFTGFDEHIYGQTLSALREFVLACGCNLGFEPAL